MEFAFLLKKLVTALLLPPFNLLVLSVAGLLVWKRWPRLSRVTVWSSILLLMLLATPAVGTFLLRSVSIKGVPDPAALQTAEAIVILGGGLRTNTIEAGDSPGQFTFDRIRHGALLARKTGLPILVTGGAPASVTPEADVMARVLREELGTPAKWIENRALDTEDNIRYSIELLRSQNIGTVLLVTHDYHMRRSMAHCRAQNLKCIAAPTSLSGEEHPSSWVYSLPNADGLKMSAMALHEMLGLLALSVK